MAKMIAPETRPAHLEDWLDSLPYADFEKTSHLLINSIDETNHLELKPSKRLRLINIYLRPYHYLLDTQIRTGTKLHQYEIKQAHARTQSLKKLTNLMCHGLLIGLEELDEEPSNKRTERLSQESSLIYLRLLSFLALLYFDEHKEVPAAIWKQLHQIYLNVEQLGLSDVQLEDPEHEDKTISFAQAYGQLLAASLAAPFQLTFGTIWEIYAALYAFRDEILIKSFDESKDRRGLFLLDLNGSTAPLSYMKFSPNRTSEAFRILDLNYLGKHLARPSFLKKQTNPEIFSQIVHAWQNPPKRRNSRGKDERKVLVTRGSNETFYFLNDCNDLDDMVSSLSVNQDNASTQQTVAYTPENWQIDNASEAGCCIYPDETAIAYPRIGEIVGIKIKMNSPEMIWHIGVIRWAMTDDKQKSKVGVQYLAHHVIPAAIRTQENAKVEGDFERAFLTYNTEHSKQITLITQKGVYNEKQEYEVYYSGLLIKFRAKALLESTDIFDTFTCVKV